MYLNNPSLLFLFGFSGFFESLSLVSLVIPFLSEGSVDFVLLEAIEESSSDWLNSLDEWGERVDNGTTVDFLIILGGIVEDA